MKKYQITIRGKIVIISTVILIGAAAVFNTLFLFILLGSICALGIAQYFSVVSNRKKIPKNKKEETFTESINEIYNKKNQLENKLSEEKKQSQKSSDSYEQETIYASQVNSKSIEDIKKIEKTKDSEREIDSSVDYFDQSPKEKVREAIKEKSLKTSVIQSEAEESKNIPEGSIKKLESYYRDKKNKMDKKEAQAMEKIGHTDETATLSFSQRIDELIEKIKGIFDFRSYKEGQLVLHDEFGIGKIIKSSDAVIVSFMNDDYREEIEFEYASRNSIPELEIFKCPKGEKEENYYYNYKEDISAELKKVIDKIYLNFNNYEPLPNICLSNAEEKEVYDLIVLDGDIINVLYKKNKKNLNINLIDSLFDDYDINPKIRINGIENYSSILKYLEDNYRLDSETDLTKFIKEIIELNNVIDYNERQFIK